MNRSAIRIALAALAIGAVLASGVQQMSEQQPNGGAAYDSAAVMVEVPAEKVYATAVRNIKAPGMRVLKLCRELNVECSRAQN